MIVAAKQERDWVLVYNEKKDRILTLQGKLAGFTATTVSVIWSDSSVLVYNESGERIQTIT